MWLHGECLQTLSQVYLFMKWNKNPFAGCIFNLIFQTNTIIESTTQQCCLFYSFIFIFRSFSSCLNCIWWLILETSLDLHQRVFETVVTIQQKYSPISIVSMNKKNTSDKYTLVQVWQMLNKQIRNLACIHVCLFVRAAPFNSSFKYLPENV